MAKKAAAWVCGACGFEWVKPTGAVPLAPFCPVCGTVHPDVVDAIAAAAPPAADAVAAVEPGPGVADVPHGTLRRATRPERPYLFLKRLPNVVRERGE